MALAYNALASLRQSQNRHKEAEAEFRKALEVRDELVRNYPDVVVYRRRLAESAMNLALAEQVVGRTADAEAAYERALALLQALRAEHPGEPSLTDLLATTLTNWGVWLTTLDRPADAVGRLDQAMAMVESAYGKSAPRGVLYRLLGARAQARSAVGRYSEAVADWDRVLPLAGHSDREVLAIMRCADQVRAGHWHEAAAEARRVADGAPARGNIVYNAACVLALATAADPDPGRSREYAAAAIAYLQRARRTGFFQSEASRAWLATDHDLDTLRGRDDFRLFEWDVEFPADPFHRGSRNGGP